VVQTTAFNQQLLEENASSYSVKYRNA
jgi:hypothetical protein